MTDIEAVRLITGDNDITDLIFTDAEVTFFLARNGDDVNVASADLLEAWAAKYGQSPDSEHIGDYSYTQKIIANMLAMANRLREMAASTPVLEWAEMDLSGLGDTTIDEDIE